MPGKTLLILGSGPGIAVHVAKCFSVRGFTHVALLARDSKRLEKDQDQVLDAIQERGYSCQVRTWTCDLCDFDQLEKTLGEVKEFGSLECVLFNAARVAGKPPLEEGWEDIERDFRVSLSLSELKRDPLGEWRGLTTATVDEPCTLQDSRMGVPTTQRGRIFLGRQISIFLRHKHHTAVQGALT